MVLGLKIRIKKPKKKKNEYSFLKSCNLLLVTDDVGTIKDGVGFGLVG